GIDSKKVRRIPFELEYEALAPALSAKGFDPSQLSAWICEGVTMYLRPKTVANVLSQVSRLAVSGSRLAFTYMPREIQSAAGFIALARMVAAGAGEPFRTTLSKSDVSKLLRQSGFNIVSDEDRNDWARRYCPAMRLNRVFE